MLTGCSYPIDYFTNQVNQRWVRKYKKTSFCTKKIMLRGKKLKRKCRFIRGGGGGCNFQRILIFQASGLLCHLVSFAKYAQYGPPWHRVSHTPTSCWQRGKQSVMENLTCNLWFHLFAIHLFLLASMTAKNIAVIKRKRKKRESKWQKKDKQKTRTVHLLFLFSCDGQQGVAMTTQVSCLWAPPKHDLSLQNWPLTAQQREMSWLDRLTLTNTSFGWGN